MDTENNTNTSRNVLIDNTVEGYTVEQLKTLPKDELLTLLEVVKGYFKDNEREDNFMAMKHTDSQIRTLNSVIAARPDITPQQPAVEQKTEPGVENKTNAISNTNNTEYLANKLKYLGFGDGLNEAIKTKMESGENFSLPITQSYTTAYGKKDNQEVDYNLFFEKSKTDNLFYLQQYHATLKNAETPPILVNISNGKGITAKETFNLLEGRAVRKNLKIKRGSRLMRG